jgi:hypothetical protein
MTDELAYQPELEQDTAREWPVGLAWLLVAGLAWLLFDLTANSSLVAVVACLKFGWYDFRSGLWLWRTDPNPKRGQTCFFFYLALAFWKISLTAVALTFGILIVTSSLRLAFPGAEILGALFSLWISCGLATLSTWFACWLAWKRGLKIWVDSSITYSRKHDQWPPVPFGTNRVHSLLLAGGVVAVTASLVFGIMIGVAIAEKQPGNDGLVLLGVILGLIAFTGGLLAVTEHLTRTICAAHWTLCWNPTERRRDSALSSQETF